MSGYTIHSITDRRTKRGRVEYNIKWEGYDDDQNSWETRINLIKDGHGEIVKAYESGRRSTSRGRSPAKEKSGRGRGKGQSSTPRSSTPRRSRSRSTSRAMKTKKSPGNVGTSTSSTSRTRKSVRTENSEDKNDNNNNNNTSSPENNSPKAKKSLDAELYSKPGTDTEGTDNEENEETNIKVKGGIYDEVFKMIGDAIASGLILRSFGFLTIVFAVLANALIPELERVDGKGATGIHMAIIIMKKTTAIPPLICLVLSLSNRYKGSYSQWVGISLVWRTAGEVLLQLPQSPKTLYYSWAIISFVLGIAAMVVAICVIMGGSTPKGDLLMQTFGALGLILVVISDCIFYYSSDPRKLTTRIEVMALGLMMITASSLFKQKK